MADGETNLSVAGGFDPPVMQVVWQTAILKDLFANLAMSITANMRSASDSQLMATGQLGKYETFIEVRWPWIILPCICICLGSIFLLLAIWQTHRLSVPVWKNSTLAVLTHGLDHLALKGIETQSLNSGLQHSAEEMTVTLGDELKLERADDVVLEAGHRKVIQDVDVDRQSSSHSRHPSLNQEHKMRL